MKDQLRHSPQRVAWRPLIAFVMGLICGAATIFSYGIIYPGKLPNFSFKTERDTRFKFTNPLIDCGGEFVELTPFKDKITAYLDRRRVTGATLDASVYFRHLNNGVWFGINPNTLFSPASLLKVPMLIAFLKQAERRPGMMQEPVVYNGTGRNVPAFGAADEQLIAGNSYTMFELMQKMIAESSNTATALIFDRIDKDVFTGVYRDFGITLTADKVTEDESFMTIRQYSTFFRVLYNASYLSAPSSELALTLLAESKYHEGLRAGLPQGIAVANKFGSREFVGLNQLHDCGIVYHPDEPYILCVMTRGTDSKALAETIATVSGITFAAVSAQVAVE